MNNSNTRKLVGMSILGATGFLLMMIAFPVIPGFSFLKIDFSDIPILVGMLLYGPWVGLGAAVIRTILHYIQTGGDMGYPIGDLASLLATISFIFPLYYVIKNKLTLHRYIWASIVATITLVIVMSVANWFVITPLYLKLLNFEMGPINELVLMGIAPFNLVKGVLVSAVSGVVVMRLLPVLQRKRIVKSGNANPTK